MSRWNAPFFSTTPDGMKFGHKRPILAVLHMPPQVIRFANGPDEDRQEERWLVLDSYDTLEIAQARAHGRLRAFNAGHYGPKADRVEYIEGTPTQTIADLAKSLEGK